MSLSELRMLLSLVLRGMEEDDDGYNEPTNLRGMIVIMNQPTYEGWMIRNQPTYEGWMMMKQPTYEGWRRRPRTSRTFSSRPTASPSLWSPCSPPSHPGGELPCYTLQSLILFQPGFVFVHPSRLPPLVGQAWAEKVFFTHKRSVWMMMVWYACKMYIVLITTLFSIDDLDNEEKSGVLVMIMMMIWLG